MNMITVPALLAVSLPEHPTFADNLQFQLTGLLVVLVTLGTLAIRTGKNIDWDAKNLKINNNKAANDLIEVEARKGWGVKDLA